MKTTSLIAIILVSELLTCFGQGFVNLNFESATTTNHPEIGNNAFTATLAGWSYADNYNHITGDSNSINYNSVSLSAASIDLFGKSFFIPAIQGNYSVYMQGGTTFSFTNGVSIMQTGQVPVSALSILYWGGQLNATFNGHSLQFGAVGSGVGYSIWQADISPYAGQTGLLVFTAPW